MDCRKWLDRYSTDCRLKYNSEATHENYISGVRVFLSYFDKYREPKEIPTQEIKKWLLTFHSINNRRNKLCAAKSFYDLTVGMPNKMAYIPYPKKENKLPIVLSKDEIQRMFDVCDNLKHKVILSILYSTGVRANELINLEWRHIDKSRMIINVVAGKGKKDRQVMLDPILLAILEDYRQTYDPKQYVLNGQFPERELRYTKSSVLHVVKQLAEKAKIEKRVWTHLMRHCSFTHMVEDGTDLSLIQLLAGHSNIKTTRIYAHISHNRISRIKSPLAGIRDVTS